MAREGRIGGRVSPDGQSYDFWQHGTLRSSKPIADAHCCEKTKRAVARNAWEPLP